MRHIRSLLACSALTLAVDAQTAPQPTLPERPAAAVARYNDAWIPVIGIEGDTPIGVAGSHPVTVEKGAKIALTPGDRFAKGFVNISDVYLTDVPVTNDTDIASKMPNELEATSQVLRATLNSEVDIQGAYVLLASRPSDQGRDTPPFLVVLAHKVGDLKASVPADLSVVLPKLARGGGQAWSILVYDGGRQVHSTDMDKVVPAYFDQLERFALAKRIAERVSKGADAQIASFRELPLGLGERLRAKCHGTTVKVDVKVGADGSVLSARMVGVSDDELGAAIEKGFANWLFLPAIKDSAAVPGSVVVPLKM